ncbi:MAG: serine/threonine-protein kinase [Myxococcota bacterium]
MGSDHRAGDPEGAPTGDSTSVGTLLGDERPDVDSSTAIEPGSTLGRYVVLSRVGAGAVGVVLSAFDPELDRKVALKLLLPHRAVNARTRVRLQREAQALAKLSHPNVVAVHDVGVHAGQVFLAMEFVAGETLRAWASAKNGERRPWQDVVRVYGEAAQGLAAAHDQGIVHRDFKPDNAMIGPDGRVRVMDFGLARGGDESSEPELEAVGLDSRTSGEARLTRTGAIMGTPAYMAPEQFAGAAVTGRSDQFSLCVALFEALCGARPFPGRGVAEVSASVSRAEIDERRWARDVPMWLRRVVRRGLARDPEDRYATMAELRLALTAGEGRRRRRRIAIVGGSLVLAAGALLGYQALERGREVAACAALGATIEEEWNDEKRQATSDSLAASEASFAKALATRVPDWLDEYATSWRTEREATCLTTRDDDSLAPQLQANVDWCFEGLRAELRWVVDELATPAETPPRGAILRAARLTPPSSCSDLKALARSDAAPPQELQAEVMVLRQARVNLRRSRFTLPPAARLETAIALRERTERAAWTPQVARVLSAEAAILQELERTDDAQRTMKRAYMLAASDGAWNVAAQAALDMANLVGAVGTRYTEGLTWIEHARVAAGHGGHRQDLFEASAATCLGRVHGRAGRYALAERAYRDAYHGHADAVGPKHPVTAQAATNLGSALSSQGRYAEAEVMYREALDTLTAVYGRDYPDSATAIGNLAVALGHLGSVEESLALHREAVALLRVDPVTPRRVFLPALANLGTSLAREGEYEEARALLTEAVATARSLPEYAAPELAAFEMNLALVHGLLGNHDQEISGLERAVALLAAESGGNPADFVQALGNLGERRLAMGALPEAHDAFARSVAAGEGAEGLPARRYLVTSLTGLGEVIAAQGEGEAAVATLTRAVALAETIVTEPGADPGRPLTARGEVLARLGRYPTAIADLERAVKLRGRAGVDADVLAYSQAALARVLWDAPESGGAERARARGLAVKARATLASTPGAPDDKLRSVDQWLTTHKLEASP